MQLINGRSGVDGGEEVSQSMEGRSGVDGGEGVML